MRVLLGNAATWPRQRAGSALAVGVFDGMHNGHRAVLRSLAAVAAEAGLVPGVVTFDPHPLTVVAPDRAPAMLTGVEHRVELLGALGVELVAVVGFDQNTRNWTPEHFAVDLLAGTLAAGAVLAGEDFRFGRDRAGDVGGLQRMGDSAGFRTIVVPLVGDGRSSSSALRAMIGAGDLAEATVELGRPHELRGVVRGDSRGLRMKLPRAMALPPKGGYVVTVGRDAAESIPARAELGADLEVVPAEPGVDLAGSLIRVRFLSAELAGAGVSGGRAVTAQQGD